MGYSATHKSLRIKWFSLVRITGLILVLTYHFFKVRFPGGFIGVDVFFAFSGFLITSLMVDEAARTQGFHLLAFYRRRFYRIVPPLVLSVLIVVPLTIIVSPDIITGIGKQVAAACGFVTNYYEIATGGSYETKFIPHLFVHTWSLAVEMHFYLLWGLLSWILGRFCLGGSHGRHGESDAQRVAHYRLLLGEVAALLAAGSYCAMVWQARNLTEFSPVYFSSVTHSFPFYLGAVTGTLSGITNLSRPLQRLSEKMHAWQAALVMLLMAGALFYLGLTLKFDQLATYRVGMLLAAALACMMIVAARLLNDQTPRLKEPWLVTFLADTSYSLYLYHWPLYVIFSRIMSNTQAVVLTVGLGLILSALSYYVIEPVIAGRPAKLFTWRPRGWRVGVPITLLTAVLTVATGYRIQEAPALSHLERTLWVGALYQDHDQIDSAGTAAIAAASPKPVKKAATAQPKPKKKTPVVKKDTGDYRGYNQNSTAAQNGIPSGVSIIGDSVTLGTRQYLQPHVVNSTVDAEGDRTMDLAYKVMMTQQQAQQLREFTVICIGTNALDDYDQQLQKIIKGIKPGHKLVLMTPYNAKAMPDWNSSKLAVIERKLPAKYPWITIADWDKVAAKHPAVFAGTDGVHFGGRPAGDKIYAETINQALIEAAKHPAKP